MCICHRSYQLALPLGLCINGHNLTPFSAFKIDKYEIYRQAHHCRPWCGRYCDNGCCAASGAKKCRHAMTVLSLLAQLDILPDLRNMAWAAAGVGDARDAARPPGWPDAGKRAAKAFGAQLPCSQLCRAISGSPAGRHYYMHQHLAAPYIERLLEVVPAASQRQRHQSALRRLQ